MTDKFKKGTLLTLVVHMDTDKWFVVAVTGKSKYPENFKVIVVAAGENSPWEVGHKCYKWTRRDDSWKVVEIEQGML